MPALAPRRCMEIASLLQESAQKSKQAENRKTSKQISSPCDSYKRRENNSLRKQKTNDFTASKTRDRGDNMNIQMNL